MHLIYFIRYLLIIFNCFTVFQVKSGIVGHIKLTIPVSRLRSVLSFTLNCKCNFKCPFMQRGQCPIHNLIILKYGFFLKVTFFAGKHIEINRIEQFKARKTTISFTYQIKLSRVPFSIFEWRFT